MKNTIHIGIAFDLNYVQHFYALASSIFYSNPHNELIIHSIITGLRIEEKKAIETYVIQKGHQIFFYEIDETFAGQFILTSKWTSAAYYRLFFPLLVPKEIHKLLYLDTDIIVVNDLSALYNINTDGYPVAAVYDNWVKTAPLLNILEEGNYFNSGMMLINLPKWREQKISEQVFDYLTRYPERIQYVDQCGLNAVLADRWQKLDWKFNVLHSRIPEAMSKKERKGFIKDKVIVHYTLDRPWKMLCRNPYRDLYHKFLHASPYKAKHKFVDFEMRKIPAFLKIKLAELYFNLPFLQRIWKGMKAKLTA